MAQTSRIQVKLNGADITASQEDKYVTFLQLAEGTIDADQLANWLRERIAS